MGNTGVTANPGVIRATRVKAGIKAATLARRSGISPSHLSNVERGRRKVSPEAAHRIAATLTAAAGDPVNFADLFAA
jgi:transcriptional regulator with XRE-family HTH domain